MTTSQAANFSGATTRQLQYWDETELLRLPELEGGDRNWPAMEVVIAQLAAKLGAKGVGLRTMRRIAADLRRQIQRHTDQHYPFYVAYEETA